MPPTLSAEAEKVEEIVSSLNPPHLVWVANINCPGQVVIAGTKSGVAAAAEALLKNGAKRALPLDVSGAFHSGLMKEAQDRLEPLIKEATIINSDIEIVMNVPGGYVSDIAQIRKFLIDQVTSPVRWEQGIRAMMDQKIDFFIEIGCGKTLAGMNKRIGTPPTLSIEKISDLELVEIGSCNSC